MKRRKTAAGLLAASLLVGAVPVVTNAAPVRIVSTSITEQSSSGYRVNVTFSADAGVSRVMMPTWTEANGQDDIVWHQASVSGNTASFYVPVSAHKGESGAYITHIYVYDRQGQFALKGENVTVPASTSASSGLSIGDVSITELSASGYRVTAKINAPSGVSKVLMPTWTNANGQDDLVWHQASVSGDTATFYVPSSAHKGESGAYTTHIYLYDNAGKLAPLKGVNVTVPSGAVTPSVPSSSLSIGDVSVTELSASGYRVTAKINAPSGVSKVLMPTWTNANGQDDLVWHQASVSGDTATFYVPSSAHKGESGTYTTHIYLYDNAGKLAPLKGVNVTVPSATVTPSVPSSSLSIGDVSITELSASGYRVTAKINAPSGVSKVLMPTWTNANGQDDLVWHQASVSGDTATFYVSSSAHKGESGAYTTHIYLYDNAGKLAPLKGVNVTVPSGANPGGSSGNNNGSGTGVLSMAIPYVTELSSNGFRVTIQFNAPAGYKKVSTAVWTAANGQDDLVWHNMTVSGNTATCYVPISEHKNEHGSYIVNAYVFETDTKYVLQGMTVPVP
ncbi:GBS Bsp-like repeat protein [Clostridiales bacterium KLE1615]|nr:GBS Bsp-like repeat protein [Clostridiales bacterium KLE1615]